jgi:hypothetical protein
MISGAAGRGNATVYFTPNHSRNPLLVSVTSNSSVRFNYIATALAHRFINSSYRTDIESEGVMYEATMNGEVDIQLFTYLGSLGNYINFSLLVYYPSDWNNVSVYDPFLYDVTTQCAVSPGEVEISGPILSRFGWWELTLQSPNYANVMKTQEYDSVEGAWLDSTSFRTGNLSRAQVTISTVSAVPYLDDPVNFTWYLPNGSLWAFDTLIPNSEGPVNSSPHLLGSENSTAGQWSIGLAWTNGTEVAMGLTAFAVIHLSSLEVVENEIEASLGDTISNFVRFKDEETGEDLVEDYISITANWTAGSIAFSRNLVRNRFEADFDTADLSYGVTLVTITAHSLYHDDCSGEFIIVLPYPTLASAFDIVGGTLEADLFVTTNVLLRYERSDHSGVQDANLSVYYSGPIDGLEWAEIANSDIGNYTVAFTGLKSGIYEVDVVFSKYAHDDVQTSFLFVVGGLGSELVLLNGSSKSAEYGGVFNLFLRFQNTTGYGIENANILVQSTRDDDPIVIGPESELGGGNYSVNLSPWEATTFTIIVGASSPIHETQYATFTLTVTEIEMVLTYEVSASAIALDRNITVTLELTDTHSNPVTDALLEFVEPPPSSLLGTISEAGSGKYVFNVSFTETGTFSFTIRASRPNYRNSTTSVSLVATNIPTSLSISGGISSAAIEYDSDFELILRFVRTDTSENISGATIEVQADDLSGLRIAIDEVSSTYRIRIDSNRTGRWVLTFTASKEDHNPDLIQFTFDVQLVSTDLSGLGPLDSIYVSRSYVLPFHYEMINGTGISSVSVSKVGSGSEHISVVDGGLGEYAVQLNSEEVGSFSVRLVFGKTGYREQGYTLTFTVIPIPLEVQVESLSWFQGLPLMIAARVVEADTNTPVDAATVRFELYTESAVLAEGRLDAVGNGVYRAQIDEEWMNDNTLRVSITVSKEGYDLETPAVFNVVSVPNPDIQAYQNFMTYGVPGILVFVFAIVGLQIYRYRKKKEKELRRENARIKQRFADAQNIMGVLVMHKSSGLPVYSRAMKQGLDESVLSAFISAISHFRGEFGLEEVNNYTVIPLSDVVRVVPTENLLCAMVTVTPPSDEQEEKMIQGANAVHDRFDSQYDDAPVEYRDEFTAALFDQMFEEHLDGYLLEEYQLNTDLDVPRDLQCVKQGVEALKSRYFGLSRLARWLLVVSMIQSSIARYGTRLRGVF